MIDFINVTKSFKVNFWEDSFCALNSVNFNIKEGSLTGFLGENGAGKTTSIKVLLGFINSDSGEIHYKGKLKSSLKEALKKIGYLPERPYFYPYLTGREFIEFVSKISDVSKLDFQKRLKLLSERLLMDHVLDRALRNYSKGMLQRIGLISSLIHNPELVILDEPAAGLDPVGRKEIKNLLVDLHREGKTVFVSSHIVSDLEEICDRVVVLSKGELVFQGKTEEILSGSKLKERIYGVLCSSDNSLLKEHSLDFSVNAKGLFEYKINEAQKKKFLEIMVKEEVEIHSLVEVVPTLENIIYKVKK